jgi:hypothetical protein
LSDVAGERFGSVEPAVAAGLARALRRRPRVPQRCQVDIDHLAIARAPAFHTSPRRWALL